MTNQQSKSKCNECGQITDCYTYNRKQNKVTCDDCQNKGIPKGYVYSYDHVAPIASDINFSNCIVNVQTVPKTLENFDLVTIDNLGLTAHNKNTMVLKWMLNFKGAPFIYIITTSGAYADEYDTYVTVYNTNLLRQGKPEEFKQAIKWFLQRIHLSYADFERLVLSKEKRIRTPGR